MTYLNQNNQSKIDILVENIESEIESIKTTESTVCLRCGKPTQMKIDYQNYNCECGSKSILFTGKYSISNNKLNCQCGNNEFELIYHKITSESHQFMCSCIHCQTPILYEEII